jgi:hypothetical protein
MSLLKLNSRVPLFLLGQLVVAVLLALAVNGLLGPTIEAMRTWPSVAATPSDLVRLDSENMALSEKISVLKKDAIANAEKRLPTVTEIKELATDYKLGIRRLELVAKSGKAKGRPKTQYTISLAGQLENNLEALRTLDEKFLLVCDAITLQRGNDDGSQIMMSLTVVVAEE